MWISLSEFGYFLMRVTLLLVVLIFLANVYLKRPVLESFMFSLALAVGLTPQLLPAIVSVNLARGAKKMAKKQVIVKRLPAIENFGSMNVFCTDKTGTLTQGEVKIHSAVDVEGKESDRVLMYAYLNAAATSGYINPIDVAIRVDKALTDKPRRMDIKFIRNFMVVFGLLSSIFDYLTFWALLSLLHAKTEQLFRTGWFWESLISASLVVRTRQSIFNSKPGKYLFMATLATVGVTMLIPWTPLAKLFGFQPLPLNFVLVISAIVLFYVIAAEIVKLVLYSRVKF